MTVRKTPTPHETVNDRGQAKPLPRCRICADCGRRVAKPYVDVERTPVLGAVLYLCQTCAYRRYPDLAARERSPTHIEPADIHAWRTVARPTERSALA